MARPTPRPASGFPGLGGAGPTSGPSPTDAATSDRHVGRREPAPERRSPPVNPPSRWTASATRPASTPEHDRRHARRAPRDPPADEVHGRPQPSDAGRRRGLARRDHGPLRRPRRRPSSRRSTPASTDEAADLRRRADDDVAAVREWSKAEIARIREETEARITDAQDRARGRDRGARRGRRGARRAGRPPRSPTFEPEMAAFFERLLAEEDPTRIATMAETMPEPPDPGRRRRLRSPSRADGVVRSERAGRCRMPTGRRDRRDRRPPSRRSIGRPGRRRRADGRPSSRRLRGRRGRGRGLRPATSTRGR